MKLPVRKEASDIVKSEVTDGLGRWRKLIFIIEDDYLYAVYLGKDEGIMISNPDADVLHFISSAVKTIRECTDKPHCGYYDKINPARILDLIVDD